jgi:hypothetical protein
LVNQTFILNFKINKMNKIIKKLKSNGFLSSNARNHSQT